MNPAPRIADLPAEHHCKLCDKTKPRDEMVVQHRRDLGGRFYIRPRCKVCHNARERGHRREYKKMYLRRWRRYNRDLNDSYWKDNDQVREAARVRAANRSQADNDAIAIQRRLRARGESVTIAEARELLEKYGFCYPSRYGLTTKGLKECERIRSRLRARAAKLDRRVLSTFAIRVMVYEMSDEEPGLVIPPAEQQRPYQYAAESLRQYHRNQRILKGERADARAATA